MQSQFIINKYYAASGFKQLAFKNTLFCDLDVYKYEDPYTVLGNTITTSIDFGLSIRAYKTFSGFHIFVTNNFFDTEDKCSENVLRALRCDSRYARFSKIRKCWHVRISAKPNRIGFQLRPRFNFYNLNEENKAKYIAMYEYLAKNYKVCEFVVQSLEKEPMTEEAALVIKKYEEETMCWSDLPIA